MENMLIIASPMLWLLNTDTSMLFYVNVSHTTLEIKGKTIT